MPSTSVAIYKVSLSSVSTNGLLLAFFLQEYPTFGNDYWNVSVDVALALLVLEGYGHIGVFDADVERYAEDTNRLLYYIDINVSI